MDSATICKDSVLLFDEQETFMPGLSVQMHASGFKRVFGICDSSRVVSFMADAPVAVMVFGLYHPAERGKELLGDILREHQNVRVVVVSAIDEPGTGVDCMKIGASDYLRNPVDNNRLIKSIRHCLEKPVHQERNPVVPVRRNSESRDISAAFTPIVTRDRKMLTIFRYMEAIAPTSQSVMITGETGTGKELVARAIHDISGRSGDFVTVNVAGLDDIMFSDTLFGHGRGAFTGAERERKGLIEMASGGTLLLDEIGDLSNASQVKLLRLLQEGEYYPLGSDNIKLSNARILVATNSSLETSIKTGEFRNDLYYRLCSHHIHLPALRERINDIPLLVEHFSKEAAKELGRPLPTASADTLDMLIQYGFPGNVRELKGLISNSVAVSTSGTLLIPKFKARSSIVNPTHGLADGTLFPRVAGRVPTLKEAEDYLISEAMRVSGGNQRSASIMLGISRQALNKRLQRVANIK
ncbi:MAG: sigma-54 dependent transcriptional regulator [Desulfuromonadales bacterium]